MADLESRCWLSDGIPVCGKPKESIPSGGISVDKTDRCLNAMTRSQRKVIKPLRQSLTTVALQLCDRINALLLVARDSNSVPRCIWAWRKAQPSTHLFAESSRHIARGCKALRTIIALHWRMIEPRRTSSFTAAICRLYKQASET